MRAMRVDPRAAHPRHAWTALAGPLQRCSTTERRRTQGPTRLPRQRLPQRRPAHALFGVALLCSWPMSDAPTRRQRSPTDPTTLQRESDMATHRHIFRSSREGRRRLRGVGLGRQSKPLSQGSRTPIDSLSSDQRAGWMCRSCRSRCEPETLATDRYPRGGVRQRKCPLSTSATDRQGRPQRQIHG